jgi:glutamate-1-semialdehyde 2,1-aminomutase
LHAHVAALGDRLRAGIDEIGRRHGIPLHATGAGHLTGLHWAQERVVDFRTRMLGDDEKVTNLVMALMNRGWFTFSFGYLLINKAFTERRIDAFHEALEDALQALELVS